MMKEESNNDGGGNSWARVCDTCRAAASTVYCKADMAYLCAGCDAQVHTANRVASRHERVFVCEACEQAPAAFLCKADAALLCTSCDADIHSANPLARRHQRVPILSISGSPYGSRANGPTEQERIFGAAGDKYEDEEEEEEEAASWLLLNNPATTKNSGNNNGFLFGGEVDEYLDLVDYNDETQHVDQYNNNHQRQFGFAQKGFVGDSVVPHVQCEIKDQQQHQNNNFQLGLDYESSKAAYSYNGSISHSVSISSTNIGVVPESATSDISISHSRPPKRTIDLLSRPPIQMSPLLTIMDREAKVLRYREKKKTRKFVKTIRYASRKAYAETRPRIKGQFAKRAYVEVEADQIFSNTLMTKTRYGIVPSF
ncbi:zinc finger protein CONSTANS-LIKE 2-like [Mangifera indica]|uniref:zinc finger protein CONSTANS-LIKE 2-like n=1 Tax=Mangifera indica TaxID=29780 RepID=UPI001CFBA4AF|nr:zinc finger protein CONSTANS-LIKE 2-like [Mangifera indica]WED40958.1 CONSTANS-like 2B [Mangifera indica]